MKTRGRPPKPRSILAAQGTLRADRHGSDDQTFNASGLPERPAKLGKYAAEIWDTVVEDLKSKRVVARIDSVKLMMLADWYSEYMRTMTKLRSTDPSEPRRYTLTTLAAVASKQVESLGASFGMDPVARARLRITEAPKSGIAKRKR